MPRPQSSAATLAVLSVAQFLIALDYSIIYIALPSIATDLHLEPSLAQWVISAYAVLFAGFLVVGGRLTDRLGAKRLFIAAIISFGLASAVGGIATDGTVLLIARGTQGLAAALLQPAVLGLIGTTFPAGPRRSRALAVWGAVGASGLAAGAILGGLLTSASWRLTFLVNVPLTLLAALGATVWVTSSRSRIASPVPLVASTLGTATVLSLVIGLTLGRSPTAVLFLIAAALLFIAFAGNERRSTNALIDRGLRRTGSLRVGAAATALYMASVGSEFYVLTLLLQSQKGYTPLQAGLAFVPLAVLVTAGNAAADRTVRRFGPSLVLLAGFMIAAVGLLWLAVTLNGTSYAGSLLPGLLLTGFGHGVNYTCMFIIGTHDVEAAQQGTAGALLTTSQYLAGALTIAVLTLVLTNTPGPAEFRWAFLLTAAAALGGAAVAVLRPLRRSAEVPVIQEC